MASNHDEGRAGSGDDERGDSTEGEWADSTEERRADRETDPAPADRDSDLRPADRVVVSYPEDLSDWGRFQVEKESFVAYLRKTKTGRVRQGDAWEEFVGVGCCGNTLDVPLRIERIEGGETFGPETAVEYEVREACGVQGGWNVQSQGGPNEV